MTVHVLVGFQNLGAFEWDSISKVADFVASRVMSRAQRVWWHMKAALRACEVALMANHRDGIQNLNVVLLTKSFNSRTI